MRSICGFSESQIALARCLQTQSGVVQNGVGSPFARVKEPTDAQPVGGESGRTSHAIWNRYTVTCDRQRAGQKAVEKTGKERPWKSRRQRDHQAATFRMDHRVVVHHPFLRIRGTLQNQDGVVSVKAGEIEPFRLADAEVASHDFTGGHFYFDFFLCPSFRANSFSASILCSSISASKPSSVKSSGCECFQS